MNKVACPHCRGEMQCPPEMANKWVACPLCKQQFVLPDASVHKPASPPGSVYASAPPAVNPYAEQPAPPSGSAYGQTGYAPPGYGQPGYQPQGGYLPANPRDLLSGVKVPILISGIMNSIAATIWLLTCFGVILTVPLAILCIFEFIYYSSANSMPLRKALSDGKTLAIWEIVVGALTLNVVVLVVGVLALTQANEGERKLTAAGL